MIDDPRIKTRYDKGELVVINPSFDDNGRFTGRVYRVEKILQVNVELICMLDGKRLRIRPEYLLPAPADGAVVQPFVGKPYEPPLDDGTVVTVAGATWNQPANELYVIIGVHSRTGKYRMVQLGGGKAWKGVSRGLLTVVDVSRISVK